MGRPCPIDPARAQGNANQPGMEAVSASVSFGTMGNDGPSGFPRRQDPPGRTSSGLDMPVEAIGACRRPIPSRVPSFLVRLPTDPYRLFNSPGSGASIIKTRGLKP